MTSSEVTPSVFTAIVCVVRASAPALLVLDHVIQLLDEFLDVPVLSLLPKVAASGNVRWFDHVYKRTLGQFASATNSPWIDEDPLAEYTLSKSIKAAVEHGHMAMVQRIHALHPRRLPVRLLPVAAATGDLAMLQWLLAHRIDDLCIPDCDPKTALPSIEGLSCCLRPAFIEAIRHEHFHVVKWLLENVYTPCESDKTGGDVAASSGNLAMVQWLHTNSIPYSFSKSAIDNAAAHGHLSVVQYLLANRSEGFTREAVHNAVIGGYDEILEVLRLSGILPVEKFEALGKWAHDAATAGRVDLLETNRYAMKDASQTIVNALEYGQLEVVQWLCKTQQFRLNAWRAACYGHLHILQWIHQEVGSAEWSVVAMDYAARHGHLAVVQWLHVNRQDGCTVDAMDSAAANGHFDVVQWLHKNRQEGCTVRAMVCAAKYGHLEIVQWLHRHRTEGCTVHAMDAAAANGHLEVVQWLHDHRTEGCTTKAMDAAARNGDLEMMIWLHEHRQVGCTPAAMRFATLSALKWLHFHHFEGWTTAVMDQAAYRGNMGALEFLHQHRTEGCPSSAATSAAMEGHLPIVQWLYEKYPHEFHAANAASRARDAGYHHIVAWLEDQQLVPKKKSEYVYTSDY